MTGFQQVRQKEKNASRIQALHDLLSGSEELEARLEKHVARSLQFGACPTKNGLNTIDEAEIFFTAKNDDKVLKAMLGKVNPSFVRGLEYCHESFGPLADNYRATGGSVPLWNKITAQFYITLAKENFADFSAAHRALNEALARALRPVKV